MTVDLMAGTIKFDRPIDFKKHYISLGGFSVVLKGADSPVDFDFECYEGVIDKEDPSCLQFLLRGLDLEDFPESKCLLTQLELIQAFQEFFIYVGEEEHDEEIIPLSVSSLSISFNAGDNDRDFSETFVEQILLSFDCSSYKYGIYDHQLKLLRDEEYESYHEALIDFGSNLKERMIDEEAPEYREETSQATFHECLEAAGFEIIKIEQK